MSTRVVRVDNYSCKHNTSQHVAIGEVVLYSIPPEIAVKIAVELSVISMPLDVLAEVFVAQVFVHFVI